MDLGWSLVIGVLDAFEAPDPPNDGLEISPLGETPPKGEGCALVLSPKTDAGPNAELGASSAFLAVVQDMKRRRITCKGFCSRLYCTSYVPESGL